MSIQRMKIESTENHYVTSNGDVYKGKQLLTAHYKQGRKYVSINTTSVQVAKLVASYFLKPELDKEYITYKDGDSKNVTKRNLSWSYQQFFSEETKKNRTKMWALRRGKNHHKSRPFYAEGKLYHTLREASEDLNVILPTVQNRLSRSPRPDYYYQ